MRESRISRARAVASRRRPGRAARRRRSRTARPSPTRQRPAARRSTPIAGTASSSPLARQDDAGRRRAPALGDGRREAPRDRRAALSGDPSIEEQVVGPEPQARRRAAPPVARGSTWLPCSVPSRFRVERPESARPGQLEVAEPAVHVGLEQERVARPRRRRATTSRQRRPRRPSATVQVIAAPSSSVPQPATRSGALTARRRPPSPRARSSAQRAATASSSPASDGATRPWTRTSRSRYSTSTVPRSRTRASSSPAAYGTATSMSTQSEASSAAISARSVSMPKPVSAETKTAPAMTGAGVSPFRAAAVDQVGLVEGDEARLVAGAELVEDGLDGRAVLVDVGVGRVDDLDEDVGAVDLLERRPERVDELVRQLVDEPDRVGDDRRLAVAELDLAAGRVERREELVLGVGDLGADERVEQRRLAGVRVADDADGRPQPPVAAAGRRLALLCGPARRAPSSSRSASG